MLGQGGSQTWHDDAAAPGRESVPAQPLLAPARRLLPSRRRAVVTACSRGHCASGSRCATSLRTSSCCGFSTLCAPSLRVRAPAAAGPASQYSGRRTTKIQIRTDSRCMSLAFQLNGYLYFTYVSVYVCQRVTCARRVLLVRGTLSEIGRQLTGGKRRDSCGEIATRMEKIQSFSYSPSLVIFESTGDIYVHPCRDAPYNSTFSTFHIASRASVLHHVRNVGEVNFLTWPSCRGSGWGHTAWACGRRRDATSCGRASGVAAQARQS